MIQRRIETAFARAGVELNGPHPWDIRINDPSFFSRLIRSGALGFGDSYVAGAWDCERIDEAIYRLLAAGLDRRLPLARLVALARGLPCAPRRRRSTKTGSAAIAHHYNIGNAWYRALLGPSMVYSCGYWRDAETLDAAQEAKLHLICEKLAIEPGMRLLDVGCGWGALARYAATHYGAKVTAITLSSAQQRYAAALCRGLDVKVLLQDYRDLTERFDRIVSVGMFEHVGLTSYTRFFQVLDRALSDNGLALLHTIGRYNSTRHTNRWIERRIFPGGKLPSAQQLSAAIEDRFIFEDWHNFGPDYDRTLMAWWANLASAWPLPPADRALLRTFRYYLLSCAGFFRSRQGQLWQVVLCKRTRRLPFRQVR